MIRFLKALLLVPVAIVAVLLAVANRQVVTLSLDPFSPEPAFSFPLPLYALVFGAVALGIVIGGIGSWFGQGKNRVRARRNRREADRWAREADRLRAYAPAEVTGHGANYAALPAQR